MDSPVPPTWIQPQDIEVMMTGFAFADEALVDQVLDLLNPETLELDQSNTTGPSDWSSSPSPSRSSHFSSTESEQLHDTEDDTANLDDEFDAVGRRKGGGPPQPLEGLTERKRQQILRRRIRNRESMRRMRARFKGAKEQLRDLETKLEQHKRRSASSQAKVVAITPGVTTPPQAEQTNAVLAAAIKQKLFALQQAELRLAQEQVAVRHQLSAHEQSVKGIRSALQDLHFGRQEMHHPEFLPSTLGGSLVRENDHAWVDRILPLLPQFATIDSPDVYALMRQSYAEVVAASRGAEKFLAHTNKVLGWRDTRMVNGTWLDFVLRKEMLCDDLETIVRRTWAMQTSGQSVNEMMPQKHNMKILAKINDSTMICARNLVYPGDPVNYCTIYLLMLVRNGEDRYVIAQRTLEPTDRVQLQQLLGPNHSYVSVFYGLVLSARTEMKPDGSKALLPGCRVSFGGRVGNGTVKYASTWSMDILVAILRWESACIAPVLRLESQDEGQTQTTHVDDSDAP